MKKHIIILGISSLIFLSSCKSIPVIDLGKLNMISERKIRTKKDYVPPQKEFTSKLQKHNYMPYISGGLLLLVILFSVSRQRNSSNKDSSNLENNSNSSFSENKEFDDTDNNNLGESNSSENSLRGSNYNSSTNAKKPGEKTDYELQS